MSVNYKATEVLWPSPLDIDNRESQKSDVIQLDFSFALIVLWVGPGSPLLKKMYNSIFILQDYNWETEIFKRFENFGETLDIFLDALIFDRIQIIKETEHIVFEFLSTMGLLKIISWGSTEKERLCFNSDSVTSWQWVIFFFFFFVINLTQIGVFWEERTSIEKVPEYDWPTGNVMVFSNWCVMARPLEVVLGYIRKQEG